MQGPELNQIFYSLGIIFLLVLTGSTIWTSITIVKTLKILRMFINKIESAMDDLSFVKEGLKQGLYSLLIKLIERVDGKGNSNQRK